MESVLLAKRYIVIYNRFKFVFPAVSDGKCHYDFEGGCLKIVSYTFKREEVEEKREFTIYYKRQINLKEGK